MAQLEDIKRILAEPSLEQDWLNESRIIVHVSFDSERSETVHADQWCPKRGSRPGQLVELTLKGAGIRRRCDWCGDSPLDIDIEDATRLEGLSELLAAETAEASGAGASRSSWWNIVWVKALSSLSGQEYERVSALEARMWEQVALRDEIKWVLVVGHKYGRYEPELRRLAENGVIAARSVGTGIVALGVAGDPGDVAWGVGTKLVCDGEITPWMLEALVDLSDGDMERMREVWESVVLLGKAGGASGRVVAST